MYCCTPSIAYRERVFLPAGRLHAVMLSLTEIKTEPEGVTQLMPPLTERWLCSHVWCGTTTDALVGDACSCGFAACNLQQQVSHGLVATVLHAILLPPPPPHRLLGSFTFWPHGDDNHADEEPLAEGIPAACMAAVAVLQRQRHMCILPSLPLSMPLPLQRLVCGVPSRGRILRSLAGITPYLTSLELCTAKGWRPVTSCCAALAALTSLRVLTIRCLEEVMPAHDMLVFNELAPAVQRLTRLTALDLAPGRRDVSYYVYTRSIVAGRTLRTQQLHGGHLQRLPASLVYLAVCLDAVPGTDLPQCANIRHLSAVTELYFEHLQAGCVLPPCLEKLTLHNSISLLPLVDDAPKHLRYLSLWKTTLWTALASLLHC